jgi:hypothetical protein
MATLFCLFEFPSLSFGVKNSAKTCQRLMDEILKNLDFCFAYMVEILVFSRSPEEHDQHLRTPLPNSKPTTSFSTAPNVFSGPRNIFPSPQPPPERVACPHLKTVSQLRRFGGMLNFYRAETQWTEALSLVLLDICTDYKEVLETSAAELIYGGPLRVPGTSNS